MTICMCQNCGDTGSLKNGNAVCPPYCGNCNTEEKREKMKQDNEAIQQRLVGLRERKEWIYGKHANA